MVDDKCSRTEENDGFKLDGKTKKAGAEGTAKFCEAVFDTSTYDYQLPLK